MTDNDTIAAIATPLGEAGLAIIRLSGTRALDIADACFEPSGKTKPSAAATHTLHHGHILRKGAHIDEVLVAVMRAPRTFTCEDSVEITCHGGILPAKLVLQATLDCGARLAQPGEFTRRAFLNGRLDLTQAEAVADLIHARTELALKAANEQLEGKLSRRIEELRESFMKMLAHVEAHIDFPEEDIAPETRSQLAQRLESGIAFMEQLLRTANEGQILRRGIRAAIIGLPNAGKSSLLNQLLGHDRAIVSPVPGTTRDTIEETANIRGLPVVFIDTAGLREAADEVEREGVRRSQQSLERAELSLHVLDASASLTEEERQHLGRFPGKKRILVLNKTDLPRKLEEAEAVAAMGPQAISGGLQGSGEKTPRCVSVSCLTGEGIEELKDAVKEMAWSGEIKSEMLEVMINARHQEALERARAAALRTLEAFRAELSLELVAAELRLSVNAIGEIVGKTTTEDLLDVIFSQFCIGK